MPYFVSRQLPNAIQSHFLLSSSVGVAFFKRAGEAKGNQIILSYTQRAKCNVTFNNFTCTWVNYRRPVRPTARCAVHPVNDVVAYVHGVCTFRQYFHLKRVLVACSFIGLIPPARPFFKRGHYRLGNAWV